ncbi:MAG: hypothetical protein ACT6FD_03510 [Methanosarcinaceae archaeon]
MVDKEQEKAFVNEIMEANGLKGASKKRLVRFLGDKYGWDKHRVQFRLTRALLAERYAGEGR